MKCRYLSVEKECSLMVIPNAQAGATETWVCSVEQQDRDCVRFLLLCRLREYVSTLSGVVLPIETRVAMSDRWEDSGAEPGGGSVQGT